MSAPAASRPTAQSTAQSAAPVLAPIGPEDLDRVGAFLHDHLDRRLSAREWAAAARAPWAVDSRDHGYLLSVGDRVVGVYLAFRSTRTVRGRVEQVCNLGAWCVEDAYRAHGLRLLRALLAQRDVTFTDLSPSGPVVALDERLGFRRIDTPTSLVPALPWPATGGVVVSSDPAYIELTLRGADRAIHRDHRDAAAARHVVITRGDEYCYVVLRRDTRKGVRCFGTVLYASNPALLRATLRAVAGHLLAHDRVAALLVEDRFVGGRRAPGGVVVRRLGRPRMVRGDADLGSTAYLYSELTCVAW